MKRRNYGPWALPPPMQRAKYSCTRIVCRRIGRATSGAEQHRQHFTLAQKSNQFPETERAPQIKEQLEDLKTLQVLHFSLGSGCEIECTASPVRWSKAGHLPKGPYHRPMPSEGYLTHRKRPHLRLHHTQMPSQGNLAHRKRILQGPYHTPMPSQGYLAHRKRPPLGPYPTPMPSQRYLTHRTCPPLGPYHTPMPSQGYLAHKNNAPP